ncbi:Ngg1-interacting factor 3 protein NIF3L1 [Phaffia rhodozyma]|uniref:Ngg1-interacting factor 3 protein NIF3L1 n=1 Tax=Phaffia rhodozyma TaxID=264483 RepID=A0A0F7SRZ4_PHARH|nr:Ngg1-interacting factor 3 protein NIF3L1 [Phaffia rhodozyma]
MSLKGKSRRIFTPDEVPSPSPQPSQPPSILDTVPGELVFLRALTHHRPLGLDRNFHMVGLLTTVNRGLVGMDGAEEGVTSEELWNKLSSMWNLERLQEANTPPQVPSPTESFHLPPFPTFQPLMDERRVHSASSVSPPSRSAKAALNRNKRAPSSDSSLSGPEEEPEEEEDEDDDDEEDEEEEEEEEEDEEEIPTPQNEYTEQETKDLNSAEKITCETSMSSTPATIISKIWSRIAPLKLAGSWDNVGLLIEAPNITRISKKILLTIDLTPAVCKEAIDKDVGLVLAYHPPIFSGLKSLTLANPLQASLLRLAASGISVFSAHTTLDAIPNGTNDFLVSPFKPHADLRPCSPCGSPPSGFEDAGVGRIIELEEGLAIEEVVKRVKKLLDLEFVQLSKSPDAPELIKKIAVCAGSGESVLNKVQADLYLTGEMGHHSLLAANAKGTSVILCGHSNTERPYLSKVLQAMLEAELEAEDGAGWEVLVSEEDKEPFITV